MKIHKNHTKSIILSILIGASAVIAITPALSYWLITNQNSYSANDNLNEDSYDIDFSTADSDAYHTVDVYRAFAEPSEYVEVKGEIIDINNSEAAFNAFEALLDEYGIQGVSDIYVSTGTSSTSDHQHYYQVSTLYSAETITLSDGSTAPLYTVNILETIMDDYESGFLGIGSYHTYSGSYSVDTYTLAVGDPQIDSEDTNGGYYGQFQVRDGEIITSKMFSTFFSSMEEDYYFSSFIYTDLTSKTPFYLNETTVEKDLNLYVVFYKQEPSSLGLSSLTDEINNNTDTLKVSNGGTTSYDLNSDIGYDSSTQTVNVGYFDRDTVVALGTTVNLCLTDGSIETSKEYTSTTSNQSQVINENDSSKTCDYTVKLTGNLVIYGELTVGAELGSATNQGVQGNINSHYVKLDLCGHTIDINYGGSLVGYGIITDSIGNGEIHVNGGGTITSPIVSYDYKGGSSTIGSFAFDVFPFSNYNIPYLQVPTYLEFGANGWGQFDAFYVMNPFSSTVLMIDGTFGVIGASSCMFTLSDGVYDESFVLMTSTPNDNVLSDTSSSYSYVVPRALERHFNFYFYNCDVKLDNFVLAFSFSFIGSVDINMNSQQFDFPISSFFSIYFYNCDMTVETRVCFLKGSSLYMDENCNLILSHRTFNRTYINSLAEQEEEVSVAASIFFMDVHIDSYIDGQTSMITTDRHNYQNLATVESYFNAVTPFWKYNVSAYRIAGSLLFEEGNTEDIPYSIAGYCDIGSVGTIDTDGTIGNTYNFHTTDSNSYNPFNNLLYELEINGSDVYFKTYDFDGLNGTYNVSTLAYAADSVDKYNVLTRGRALPLISNGVAYSFSNVYNDEDSDLYSINMCGSYNKELDLIDPGDGYFYYYNSNDVEGYDKPYTGTEDTTSSSRSGYHRNREYNHATRLKQCSYDSTNHYITDSDVTYVLFSGCYLPYSEGNVNLQRLISSTTISSVDSLDLAVSYNTTYNRWTR